MATKTAKTPRMKKLPNDPKERGIVQHAFRALTNFFESKIRRDHFGFAWPVP